MGICKCKEGKSCPVHFFRRTSNPDKYASEKQSFEVKFSDKTDYKKAKSKSKKEVKLENIEPCDCDNCDCDDHTVCDCDDCDCINCSC